MKTYLEKATDREIIYQILGYIAYNEEDKFGERIELATDGLITKDQFSEWLSNYDVNELLE